MKKKVVHLVYSMGCGGLEKVIVNLINGSHAKLEHVIITLIPDFEMVSAINANIEVHCLHKKPGKDLGCHNRLYRLLKNISPDIINTYNFGTIEYHVTAFLAGVKMRVHSDHGHGGDAQDGLNKKNNTIRRLCSLFVHEYIVVSQDLKDWVINTVGVSAAKVHVIQNGVPIPESSHQQEHEGIVFCTVGRLESVKNQGLMIDAFALLQKRGVLLHNKVVLKLVGDGSLKSSLEAQAAEHGVKDNVVFLGYREDVHEQLISSDVFILSSHYEAMPMTILEAMALKIPVITTDVGGIRHFIGNDNATFTEAGNVDLFADCLQRFIESPSSFTRTIENSYQLVCEKYSLDVMCNAYVSLYLK